MKQETWVRTAKAAAIVYSPFVAIVCAVAWLNPELMTWSTSIAMGVVIALFGITGMQILDGEPEDY